MLDRTGTRAALSWLRLALAAGASRLLDGNDLGTVARRPSRGLSPGILKALGRGEWSLSRLEGFATGLDDTRLRTRLTGLHDDLSRLGRRARDGATTADLLTEVRDSVGLAQALDRLDDARSAPGGGHIDDLDALVLVAQAHPDPSDFEVWLRQRLRPDPSAGAAPGRRRPSPSDWGDEPPPLDPGPDFGDEWTPPWLDEAPPDPAPADDTPTALFAPTPTPPANDVDSGKVKGRVTLSTVHRVKGLEWPHVVVWDASDGVMPHRLNQSGPELEEERRVFHVAITRARRSATILARAGAPSAFLAELTGEAPHRPAETIASRITDAGGRRRGGDSRTEPGSASGGHDAADRLRQRRDRRGGAAGGAPVELDEAGTRRGNALREWRRKRAKDDGVPAYVVLHDRHLDGVAARAPATLDELAGCDGIGPTKLDRYGDDILAVLEAL
jgi:superfamily I DNA/RNA helicase